MSTTHRSYSPHFEWVKGKARRGKWWSNTCEKEDTQADRHRVDNKSGVRFDVVKLLLFGLVLFDLGLSPIGCETSSIARLIGCDAIYDVDFAMILKNFVQVVCNFQRFWLDFTYAIIISILYLLWFFLLL